MVDMLRAQVTLAHRDGLPRDNVSMNYWFASDDANEANATLVAQRVRDVLKVPVAPRGFGLARHLGMTIADAGHTVKVYDYDMATGERLSFEDGPPIYTLGFDIAGIRAGGDTLPSEVACCVSYKNTTGAVPGGGNFGTPPARRRGRVYFGPIGTNDADMGVGVGNSSRPAAGLIDYLGAAHFALMGTGTPNDWCVYSRPFDGRPGITAQARKDAGGPFRALPALPARPGQAYIIEAVSVDNAWDTQRRRGERATARTAF